MNDRHSEQKETEGIWEKRDRRQTHSEQRETEGISGKER